METMIASCAGGETSAHGASLRVLAAALGKWEDGKTFKVVKSAENGESGLPCVLGSGGEVVAAGLPACAAAMVNFGAKSSLVLDGNGAGGAKEALCAEVEQWLTWAGVMALNPSKANLMELNAWLQGRTTLCDSCGAGDVTVADIVVLGAVLTTLVNMSETEAKNASQAKETGDGSTLSEIVNVFRWADFVQHSCNSCVRRAGLPAIAVDQGEYAVPNLSLQSQAHVGPTSKPKADAKTQEAEPSSSSSKKKKGGGADSKESKAGDQGKGDVQSDANSKKDKKEKKDRAPKEKPAEKQLTAQVLDIRVGTILKAWKHPDADSLYVEEIDVGEDKPRQVVSGLVKFIPEERMQGARCIVLMNMKPQKMRGITSQAMVLCASTPEHDKVDFIVPPEGAENGERIIVEGYEGEPEPILQPKKKQFETLKPDLLTDAAGIATYKGAPFSTSKGPCKSSLSSANIG